MTEQIVFKPKRSQRRVLPRLPLALVSAVIAIGTFFAGGFLLFPAFSQWTGVVTEEGQAWSLLEGMTGLATLSLAMGGIVFAAIEYYESSEERADKAAQEEFNLYQDIFDQLMDPDEIAARRWIILNIPLRAEGEPEEEWILKVRSIIFQKPPGSTDIAPGHGCVKQVLNTFDYLGFVACHYWDLEGPLIEWMNPPIAKVWERIGPYVEEEARRRNEPDYYKSARDFGNHCIAWRDQKAFPEPTIVEDAL
jgi:hypothetical protein